jgi:hypothetical protein
LPTLSTSPSIAKSSSASSSSSFASSTTEKIRPLVFSDVLLFWFFQSPETATTAFDTKRAALWFRSTSQFDKMMTRYPLFSSFPLPSSHFLFHFFFK